MPLTAILNCKVALQFDTHNNLRVVPEEGATQAIALLCHNRTLRIVPAEGGCK
jgi:hypothetical protein